MPVFLVPLHESNDCHNPEGPAGGQFCSKGRDTWFAGSKVADADGQPLEVYHGSSHHYSGEVDFSRAGESTNAGNVVLGAFFTDSYMLARDLYAGRRGRVVVAHLAIKNPLRLKGDEYENDAGYELRKEARDYLERDPETAEDWLEFKDFLIRQGHDGIQYTGGGGRVWVVFRPDQIHIREIEDP